MHTCWHQLWLVRTQKLTKQICSTVWTVVPKLSAPWRGACRGFLSQRSEHLAAFERRSFLIFATLRFWIRRAKCVWWRVHLSRTASQPQSIQRLTWLGPVVNNIITGSVHRSDSMYFPASHAFKCFVSEGLKHLNIYICIHIWIYFHLNFNFVLWTSCDRGFVAPCSAEPTLKDVHLNVRNVIIVLCLLWNVCWVWESEKGSTAAPVPNLPRKRP